MVARLNGAHGTARLTARQKIPPKTFVAKPSTISQ